MNTTPDLAALVANARSSIKRRCSLVEGEDAHDDDSRVKGSCNGSDQELGVTVECVSSLLSLCMLLAVHPPRNR